MSNFFLFFRHNVEAAVKLVELMELAEQIEAVELWNTLSEDLQNMVNKSALGNNMNIKVENEMDTNKSSPLCDLFDKKNTPLQLLPVTDQNESGDYYVLSAVVDLPEGCDNQDPRVQFLNDQHVSIENYNTVVSDVSIKNEKNQKPDKHKPSEFPSIPKSPIKAPSLEQSSKRAKKKVKAIKNDGPKLYTKSQKEFPCDMCEKKFRTGSTLHSHRAMHLGTYSCKICKKWCSSKGGLTSHMRMHTGEKPFQCEVCKKFYRGRPVLRIHMRIHTGERPYECNECGKTFTHSSALKGHMDIHMRQKAYKCDTCGESFYRRHGLNSHRLMIHGIWNDKHRTFKCKSCDEFFYTQAQLENHSTVHKDGTMAKPFICEVCKTPFAKQKALDEHINVHKGLKPFECKHCEDKFATTYMLNRHRERRHKTEKMQDLEDKKAMPPKKRRRSRKSKSDKDEETNSILEASNQPTPKIGGQIFAVVMDPETASLQMGNQALLYNPETQETIPAGENMESVLDALNILANGPADTS